ncbi:hypothetical protein GCM10028775_76830 [Catellatospora paridis]
MKGFPQVIACGDDPVGVGGSEQALGGELPFLWLADRGGRRLAPDGIKIILRRLGE